MRLVRTAGTVAVCAAAMLAGCGGELADMTGSKQEPSGGATAAASPGHSSSRVAGTYVYNTWESEQGRADQKPNGLTVSEFTTLNDIVWGSWAEDAATGSGDMSGTWCLPQCQEEPFNVVFRLSDPEEVQGRRYFTDFTVEEYKGMTKKQIQRLRRTEDGDLMLP